MTGLHIRCISETDIRSQLDLRLKFRSMFRLCIGLNFRSYNSHIRDLHRLDYERNGSRALTDKPNSLKHGIRESAIVESEVAT